MVAKYGKQIKYALQKKCGQSNGYDFGIFVIMYGRSIFKNRKLKSQFFFQSMMGCYKYEIADEMLKNTLKFD